MIINDFISLLDTHISLNYEIQKLLVDVIIPSGIGEILDYLNLDIQTFYKKIEDKDYVRLPLNFGYILKLSINNNEYERVPISKLNSELKYSIVFANNMRLKHNIPLYLNNINYASLDILRSSERNGYLVEFINVETGNRIGYLYDNENIYYPDLYENDNFRLLIKFSNNDDIIRFRNNDILKIKSDDILLNISLVEGINEYYIAEDGSLYSDENYTNLIKRAFPMKNGYFVKFVSEISGEVEILYKMSKPFYISLYEDEPLIDQYYDLLKYYCLKEIYLKLNKPIKMNEYKQEYKEKLMLMLTKKGKRQEFKVQRQIIPSTKLYRSPVTR